MPPVARSGAYCSVEELIASVAHLTLGQADAAILDHLLAMSREVEGRLLRAFFPSTGMNAYRWPPFHVAYSWEVWTEDDLLSVSSVEVAAGGVGAVPVAITNYYLEPQQWGPPYSRIEVDLSSQDIFQAGPTPQRSVQISGQWGYCAQTVAAGTLAAPAGATDGTLTLSNGHGVEQGDVILIDQEAIYVDASPNLHTSNVAVVQRGVNGTTAAAHLSAASVARYRAPADIRRLVRAGAIMTFQQDQQAWAQAQGSAPIPLAVYPTELATLWQNAERAYQRVRMAAV